MSDIAKEIRVIPIEQEVKQSYLDYAMSVIVGRALPDIRDGLKPVHRRVLFAMSELGNDWNKAYKKSARIVGDVIGKYHPHGDTAVYDTIVRMAQPFSMRYVLVDGQGNFGSVDGDAPAAMRYTEVRMSRLAHALLADLDKETVDFVPNYDNTEMAPAVLPARVPNLLINGTSGIAVGMATNIPPHNMSEVIDACVALLHQPELTYAELLRHIQGPDFPTGGLIIGRSGIIEAYRTGRGRVYVRAKSHIEHDDDTNRDTLVVTELPYQVNKARLVEKIAELIREKKIEGISALRDESDKDGMRMVMELRRGEIPDVVLNNLYKHTQMQIVFAINSVALVDARPETLTLKQILEAFLKHRRQVVTKRTVFELKKARERGHLLEGLAIALANMDEVIALIRAAESPLLAKEQLLARTWQVGLVATMLENDANNLSRPDNLAPEFGIQDNCYRLSPPQAQAILDLRLHRLTGLEQEKILDEYRELLAEIKALLQILCDPARLLQVIEQELLEVKKQFGDARRTEIIEADVDIAHEDLITKEDVVVTLSHEGYAKTQPLAMYQAQHRGGRGKAATTMKETDFIERLLITCTHDTLLCFSSLGKVYWLKVYQIPQASRTSRGRPLVNLLSLTENERINAILPVRDFTANQYVFMAMSSGTVKKVALSEFSRPRANGIIAVDLQDGDRLIGVDLTDGNNDILLFSNTGKVVRFHESGVRHMGRTARGVRGMRLQTEQRLISLIVAKSNGQILTATEAGYGKRTALEEYRLSGRGGQGVISIQVNERNGNVVSAIQVFATDEVMLISNRGTLVRLQVSEISVIGRNTQGVRLIRLSSDEKLAELQRVEELHTATSGGEINIEPSHAVGINKSSDDANNADDSIEPSDDSNG